MSEANKLIRLLKLIESLKTERLTVHQIVSRFEISIRTAYRYLEIIEESGFYILETDFNHRHYIIPKI